MKTLHRQLLWSALLAALLCICLPLATRRANAQTDPPESGPRLLIRVRTNVRSGPSTRFRVLAVATPGERYAITGRTPAGNWWRIDFDGQPGWLYAPLVQAFETDDVPPVTDSPAPTTPTPSPPDAPTATPQPGEPSVRILRSMNIRQGPGTGYPVVGVGRPGQAFPATGRTPAGDWWRIDFDGAAAWVYAPLVQATNAQNLPEIDATPAPAPPGRNPSPANPSPAGTVRVYESAVTLPTYPYERYTSDGYNPAYNWTFQRFDAERFADEKPQPQNRTYRLLVLENEYLKVTILPELGGRIWQAIHKPTGANLFYQNPVVKPSEWGPAEQLGWLALGGLEWALPVVEHGYAWGEAWRATAVQHSPQRASVTVALPANGRALAASVTVTLRAGVAAFEVAPALGNRSGQPLAFSYWSTGMLAPGAGNKPGPRTQFVLPGQQMTVHSTGDPRLPEPGSGFGWPVHNGVDYSRLGNWNRWLGFFERPAAHGPFAGVYDPDADAGVVRLYPAPIARGSKVFGLGWSQAIGRDQFTDDDSAYVELHGGLAPTFDTQHSLPAGGSVSWREVWYPVSGLGGLSFANESGALFVGRQAGSLRIGLYPLRRLSGRLLLRGSGGDVLAEWPVENGPGAPFSVSVSPADLPGAGPLRVQLVRPDGQVEIDYTYYGAIR